MQRNPVLPLDPVRADQLRPPFAGEPLCPTKLAFEVPWRRESESARGASAGQVGETPMKPGQIVVTGSGGGPIGRVGCRRGHYTFRSCFPCTEVALSWITYWKGCGETIRSSRAGHARPWHENSRRSVT